MEFKWFDIPIYSPGFLSSNREVIRECGSDLRNLRDQALRSVFVMNSPGDACDWWTEGPVVLDFDRAQIELFAFELGFSITFGAIDVAQSPWRWNRDGEGDTAFEWTAATQPEFVQAIGQTVRDIELCELHSTILDPGSWAFGGVDLMLENGSLCVFNALDELGVSSAQSPSEEVRRQRVE